MFRTQKHQNLKNAFLVFIAFSLICISSAVSDVCSAKALPQKKEINMTTKKPAKPAEAFDCEQAYDELIGPLVAEIAAICREHRIPAFMTFVYAYSPLELSGHCTTDLNDMENRFMPELLTIRKQILCENSVTALMAGAVMTDTKH